MNPRTPDPKRTRPSDSPRPTDPGYYHERMVQEYLDWVDSEVRAADMAIDEDIRIRRDGQPSAAPPAGCLPVKYWATILAVPDGADDTDLGIPTRLYRYQRWLKQLHKRDLYDGPTDLTYVERKDDDDAR